MVERASSRPFGLDDAATLLSVRPIVMADKPTLRFATREGLSEMPSSPPRLYTDHLVDVPIILGLIKELAEYENASDSVEATEASLALTLALAPSSHHHHNSHHKHDKSSHDQNSQPLPDAPLSSSSHSPPTQSSGYAKTILITAKPEDEVAGMALYFHNYSTWRAKPGIYLEDLFVKPKYRKRGYGTLLLKELAKEVTRIDGGRLEWSCLKWNEPSLKFYESLGAKQMDGWVGLRVDGEELEKLAKGEVEPAEEPKAAEG